MDKLGHQKRDLMVSDVKKACDALFNEWTAELK